MSIITHYKNSMRMATYAATSCAFGSEPDGIGAESRTTIAGVIGQNSAGESSGGELMASSSPVLARLYELAPDLHYFLLAKSRNPQAQVSASSFARWTAAFTILTREFPHLIGVVRSSEAGLVERTLDPSMWWDRAAFEDFAVWLITAASQGNFDSFCANADMDLAEIAEVLRKLSRADRLEVWRQFVAQTLVKHHSEEREADCSVDEIRRLRNHLSLARQPKPISLSLKTAALIKEFDRAIGNFWDCLARVVLRQLLCVARRLRDARGRPRRRIDCLRTARERVLSFDFFSGISPPGSDFAASAATQSQCHGVRHKGEKDAVVFFRSENPYALSYRRRKGTSRCGRASCAIRIRSFVKGEEAQSDSVHSEPSSQKG